MKKETDWVNNQISTIREYVFDLSSNRSRLTVVKKNGGTTATYTYMPNGLRMSKTVNGQKSSFLWDGSNVLADTTGTGQLDNVYIRGRRLIKNDSDMFYLYNGHGDVVQLADDSGSIDDDGYTYEYDAFGNVANARDYDNNPWRYCGEYYDDETDSIYLRARYYSPKLGRFTSEDPIRSGGNWYSYCGGNPVMLVDPMGLKDVAVREYAEGYGATVTWTGNYTEDGVTYSTASVNYGGKTVSVSGKLVGGKLIADDSVFNNTFGWAVTSMTGAGYARLSNAPNKKPMPLKNGWYYRYDIDDTGGHNHMHLYNKSEKYSQNDDGSNHHDPKGGSGPPKSIQKLLKKKTGWDWEAKAKHNASKATVETVLKDLGYFEYVIRYADGSTYTVDGSRIGYNYIPPANPGIDTIIRCYYNVNTPSSSLNNGSGVYIPGANPVIVPTQVPVTMPIPIFG